VVVCSSYLCAFAKCKEVMDLESIGLYRCPISAEDPHHAIVEKVEDKEDI
jgi:hypothetical protein